MAFDLKPLRIGSIQVWPPATLASLAGYTDLPYRRICRSLGAPFCATEMMLDRQLLLPGKLRARLVQIDQADHPVAGQIIGNDPATMAQAAAELCRSGFDVVDINLACPVRKVLSRRRGGYFMQKPAQALEIVRAVLAASDRPVTIKLRIGFAKGQLGSDEFWQIAQGAFDAGVAALNVHARTVDQRYAGNAHWQVLAEVKRRFAEKTIVGSGDVTGPAAAVEMIQATGVDGVLFARAALGNPWIFRQLSDYIAGRPLYKPSLSEQRQVLLRHFGDNVAMYGQRRGPKMMRKFGIKYARLHLRPSRVRAAFINIKSTAAWEAVLEKYYRDDYDPLEDSGGRQKAVAAPEDMENEE